MYRVRGLRRLGLGKLSCRVASYVQVEGEESRAEDRGILRGQSLNLEPKLWHARVEERQQNSGTQPVLPCSQKRAVT